MRKTKRLPLEEIAPYLWEEPRLTSVVLGTIDWLQVFGQNHSVEIEVGCGKGLFLLTAAMANPDVNFFGIEIVRKYQLYTATRIAIRRLPNVRVACTDARILLRDRVSPRSVQAIHVYFPDPWWKKRHHKRRVFTPEFVASCAAALKPGGMLYLATDVEEYFRLMSELCGLRPDLRETTITPPPAADGMDYLTNFERKARLVGQPVFRAKFERI